jgi:uncharacterized membrane protein YfcA
MNTINEFSSHLNSFANLFGSINNLFCQVRWLETNLRNSSPLLLAIVGAIAVICLILTFSHDSGEAMQFIIVAFVVGLVALFFYRRHTLGPVESDFQSIMFGNNQTRQRDSLSATLPPKVQRVGPTGNIYTIVQPHEVDTPSSIV